MVEWLAGNRIIGTTAERPLASLQSPSVGGWVELARTTLGSAGDAIDVSALADKRYYMVLESILSTGDTNNLIRLNADSGSNYATRGDPNGGTETTSTSTSVLRGNYASAYQTTGFHISYLSNLSTKEKLGIGHSVDQEAVGAGTAPNRQEWVGKHAQTSNPISQISSVNVDAGSYNTGSECVVLGWDPADTHTSNFWEELTTKQGTGAGSPLTTDTFTAKKYLWIQMYIDASAAVEFRVGTGGTIDTGSNYALRTSSNGGTDETKINQVHLNAPTSKGFINMFIVNNSANEKLCIYHLIDGSTTGAANAPNRREYVGKWINTSGQIDVVQLYGSGVTFNADSVIKVWGSD